MNRVQLFENAYLLYNMNDEESEMEFLEDLRKLPNITEDDIDKIVDCRHLLQDWED